MQHRASRVSGALWRLMLRSHVCIVKLLVFNLSNSLYLELTRNWTGLLVEANSKAFEELKAGHRKATAVQGCLSLKPAPEEVSKAKTAFQSR